MDLRKYDPAGMASPIIRGKRGEYGGNLRGEKKTGESIHTFVLEVDWLSL